MNVRCPYCATFQSFGEVSTNLINRVNVHKTHTHVPTIFTVESVVAAAPNKEALQLVECANRCIPPNAVVPETILDITILKKFERTGKRDHVRLSDI